MPHSRLPKENSKPDELKFVSRGPDETVARKRSGTLLGKVRSLFSWIASWATQEAREEVGRVELVPQVKRLLSVHLSGHLLQRAERSVQHIEQAKEELLVHSGQPAWAFIERYVEPILTPAREILIAARTGGSADVSRWAIAGIEMVSLVQEEDRLRRKIYEFCLEKTRDAILEDMAFIVSYPHELVSSSWILTEEQPELINRIEAGLQPLLHEYETLLTRHPRSFDLNVLFRWKLELDEERQRLHDLSLATIDEQIQQMASLWSAIQGESASEAPPWPLSVFELEETSTRLREVLEAGMADRTNERVVAFFERMRGHIQVLVESEEGDVHEEALLRLKEHVRAIERLLGLKESQ
jgi:hypothetical protein